MRSPRSGGWQAFRSKPQREPGGSIDWEERKGGARGRRASRVSTMRSTRSGGGRLSASTTEKMRGVSEVRKSGGGRLSVVDREECEEERGECEESVGVEEHEAMSGGWKHCTAEYHPGGAEGGKLSAVTTAERIGEYRVLREVTIARPQSGPQYRHSCGA